MEVITCLHCQKPVRHGEKFCCSGCQAAYHFIDQLGLSSFYEKASPLPRLAPSGQISSVFSNSERVSQSQKAIGNNLLKTTLFLEGITCSACSWLLEKSPLMLPSIRSAVVNAQDSTITISYDSATPLLDVAELFNSLGYRPHLIEGEEHLALQKREQRIWFYRIGIAAASAIASMHISLNLYAGHLEGMPDALVRWFGVACLFVSIPALTYSALPFYRNAWTALKFRKLNLDVLVTLAIFVGSVLSLHNLVVGANEIYFDSLTMLVALLLSGRMIVFFSERWIQTRKRGTAFDILNPTLPLKAGDLVTVASHTTFPCDGEVVAGQSLMNCAWLTGEETPVQVTTGSQVYAGAINLGDELQIRISKLGRDSRAGQILQQLNQIEKSGLSLLSEKLEQNLVLASLGLSLALWALRVLTLKQWVAWLVITCPCALGLAVPLVLSSAMMQGLAAGILFRRSTGLERLSELDTIVFDKTGTLTTNTLQVKSLEWLTKDSAQQESARQIMIALSRRSYHPTLQALQLHLGPANSPLNLSAKEELGQGLTTHFESAEYRLGRKSFALGKDDTSEFTEIFLSKNGAPVARVTFDSELKAAAKSVVSRLAKKFRLFILSGDRKNAVADIAQRLGLPPERALGDQSPEAKLRFIDDLTRSHKVMMVGDGFNDALAFKKSHVGVGIAGGASTSLATADIFLMDPSLESLEKVIGGGKRVRRAIQFNFAWAVLFNLVGIALVMKGVLGPIACAILMPASSVVVILSATQRRYFR